MCYNLAGQQRCVLSLSLSLSLLRRGHRRRAAAPSPASGRPSRRVCAPLAACICVRLGVRGPAPARVLGGDGAATVLVPHPHERARTRASTRANLLTAVHPPPVCSSRVPAVAHGTCSGFWRRTCAARRTSQGAVLGGTRRRLFSACAGSSPLKPPPPRAFITHRYVQRLWRWARPRPVVARDSAGWCSSARAGTRPLPQYTWPPLPAPVERFRGVSCRHSAAAEPVQQGAFGASRSPSESRPHRTCARHRTPPVDGQQGPLLTPSRGAAR